MIVRKSLAIIIQFCMVSVMCAEDMKGVRLSIDFPAGSNIVVRQPLVVEVVLSNGSPNTVKVEQLLCIEDDYCKYLVAGSNTDFKSIFPSIFVEHDPIPQPLAPGSVVRHQEILLKGIRDSSGAIHLVFPEGVSIV